MGLTSNAKIVPPIGAVNADARPDADPDVMKSRLFRSFLKALNFDVIPSALDSADDTPSPTSAPDFSLSLIYRYGSLVLHNQQRFQKKRIK